MDDYDTQPGRRRKGSLRKTVLLGVERLRLDRRDSGAAAKSDPHATTTPTPKSPTRKLKSPTKFAFELPSANSSTESYIAPTTAAAAASDDADPSAATSPTSPSAAYTSNTDDDDGLSLPTASLNHNLLLPALSRPSASPSPPSSDTSSVPAARSPPPALRQRRVSAAAKKTDALPAAPATAPLPPIEEEWDYSETAWWGWVILVVTWAVFVVGMGSCLEVWSWAWDVGETPYAPPELEDDPTLPIVGYYPALFVLTAVMSWIWVMVAWVGLKYFKHAKIQGDDT